MIYKKTLKKKSTKLQKALQICDHILKLIPGDEDAVTCKVHTLVTSNRHADCIKVPPPPPLFPPQHPPPQQYLEGESERTLKRHALHLAYAYYRVNKLDKAEETLKLYSATEATEEAIRHLKAQIEYKKENYAAAVVLLKEQRAAQGEDDEEILCNLSAAEIGNGDFADAVKILGLPNGDLTHDLLFNKACVFLQKEEWDSANKALLSAERDMKEFHMEGGDFDKDALADDLASVRVQRAYIASRQGDDTEALAILNEVMRRKPTSLATLAVASNNLCAVRQEDGTIFDAFKRMKPLRSASFDSKLNTSQRLAVRFNTVCLTTKRTFSKYRFFNNRAS